MPRPRRTTGEAFYDVFADFTLEDQAAALKILEQIHRLAVREADKVRAVTAAAAVVHPDRAMLAGPTALYIDDKRIDRLDAIAEPGNNAALLLADEPTGPKQ